MPENLTDSAKAEMRKYYRAYRQRNKSAIVRNNQRYWENRAKKAATAGVTDSGHANLTDGTTNSTEV